MRVTVVSPHLDDAVLSVGGTIVGLTRRGVHVEIVTVFAGDPQARTPASYWDASRGATQGEAVRQRRDEDVEAAGELGATTAALPWPDNGYPGPRDPDAIWSALAPLLEETDVTLLPGWPFSHADHRYATLLVLERLTPSSPVVFYAEHPYASEPLTLLKSRLRGRTKAPLRHAYGAAIVWRRNRLDEESRGAQNRAVARYAGELENLGLRARWDGVYRQISGEWVGMGDKAPVPAEFVTTLSPKQQS